MIAGCQICGATPSYCLNCYHGYYMSSPGECKSCTNGKGKDRDDPLKVTPTDPNATTCTATCDPDYLCKTCSATQTGECISCTPGRYRLPITHKCTLHCDPACAECYDNTATGCYSCSTNYYLSAKNTCTKCPNGTSKPAHTSYPTTLEKVESCQVNNTTSKMSVRLVLFVSTMTAVF